MDESQGDRAGSPPPPAEPVQTDIEASPAPFVNAEATPASPAPNAAEAEVGAVGGENPYDLAGETEDIYRVPTSNQAIDSKIPAGQEVLYKVRADRSADICIV